MTLLHAPYCGRMTFRGLLEPLQSTSVLAQLCTIHPGTIHPGTYTLSGWRLETEVGEPGVEEGSGQVRHRYEQKAPADDESSIVISDLS
ncbi:hypothetical protein DFH29DRAFT_241390 [Suillus ampliporus]|nr:hypothetical protein DFH29DRAFT_241390 [Suillus ampliporus]